MKTRDSRHESHWERGRLARFIAGASEREHPCSPRSTGSDEGSSRSLCRTGAAGETPALPVITN